MTKSKGPADDIGLNLAWPQAPAPVGKAPGESVFPEGNGSGAPSLAVIMERIESLEKQVRLLARSLDVVTKQVNQPATRSRAKAADGALSGDGSTKPSRRTSRAAGSRTTGET